MDVKAINENLRERAWSEINKDAKTKLVEENLKFLGLSGAKKSIDEDMEIMGCDRKRRKCDKSYDVGKENIPIQPLSKRNVQIPKKNFASKENIPPIHDLKRLESDATERKKLPQLPLKDVPLNVTKPQIPIDRQEKTSADKEMSPSDCKEHLPSCLTDLILKTKSSNKINRPPNAFMLFAKKHRREIGLNHPQLRNREISSLLGNKWRQSSDEEKAQFYWEAQALEKLHKETYPDYVYSPREARLQKQSQREKRSRITETLSSTKVQECVQTSQENFNESSGFKINQEPAIGNAATEHKTEEGTGVKQDAVERQKRHVDSPVDPRLSSSYYSHPSRYWPNDDTKTGGRGGDKYPSYPFCRNQAYDRPYSYNNFSHPSVYDRPLPSPTSMDSQQSFAHHPNPFYPFHQPIFPPTMWNPWLMWRHFYYPPNPPLGQSLEDPCHTWFQRPNPPPPFVPFGPSLGGGETFPEDVNRVIKPLARRASKGSSEEFDDEFKPLIIDEDKDVDVDVVEDDVQRNAEGHA